MNVFLLYPAPCPPTNVQASISCDLLTATVSWQQSNLAVGYVAYLDDQSGHYASCVGADVDTSCVVSGLSCGSVYRVWVKALGKQHNSTDSSAVSLTSGTSTNSFGIVLIKDKRDIYCIPLTEPHKNVKLFL